MFILSTMGPREKLLYHQIHPLKLLVDWGTAALAATLLWEHRLLPALLVGLVPPLLATVALLRWADLEPYKASPFGRYVSQYMSRGMEGVRLLGLAVAWIGAWAQAPLLLFLGVWVILAAWARGRFKRFLIWSVALVIGLPVAATVTLILWIRHADQTNGTIGTGDAARTYLLHVPARYDRAVATPLVISLHGAAGWPAQQANVSRWDRLADSLGFIVVYPGGAGSPRIWHVERGPDLEEDVRFIGALIDTIEAHYHIDPARVYVNGLSNGGGMSFVLSCTLADRIAAVGLVAAAQTLPWGWCPERPPVPMIAFHGTADPIVPYVGGRSPIAPDLFPNVPAWIATWAHRNGCTTATDSTIAIDVTRETYGGCADSAAVVFYTVIAGGHSWPGGKPLPRWMVGLTSMSVDATALMWDFFRAHPKGPRAPAPQRGSSRAE